MFWALCVAAEYLGEGLDDGGAAEDGVAECIRVSSILRGYDARALAAAAVIPGDRRPSVR